MPLFNPEFDRSTFNAKGDLITATANDSPVVLSVGTDGKSLIADSAQSSGLSWSYPSMPTTRVYRSAGVSQSSSGNFQVVQWDAESWDSDTMHSTVSTLGRLTAPVAGKYLVVANLVFSANVAGKRYAAIAKNANGAPNPTQIFRSDAATVISGDNSSCMVSMVVDLDIPGGTADYVEIYGYQNTGGSLAYVTGDPASAGSVCWASMTLISAYAG
jgi:hypothetical protein